MPICCHAHISANRNFLLSVVLSKHFPRLWLCTMHYCLAFHGVSCHNNASISSLPDGNTTWGVNGETGELVDMKELKIWEPLAVKLQTVKTAVEVRQSADLTPDRHQLMVPVVTRHVRGSMIPEDLSTNCNIGFTIPYSDPRSILQKFNSGSRIPLDSLIFFKYGYWISWICGENHDRYRIWFHGILYPIGSHSFIILYVYALCLGKIRTNTHDYENCMHMQMENTANIYKI